MALWTPAEITTALWLDAADSDTITLNSGNVSQWDDKSGNSKHVTQSTSSSRPAVVAAELNGLNIVRFDGTNDHLAVAGGVVGASDVTVIAVSKCRSYLLNRTWICGEWIAGGSPSNNEYLLAHGPGDSLHPGFFVEIGATHDKAQSATTKTNVWSIIGGTHDGAQIKAFVDGSEVASTAAPGTKNQVAERTFRLASLDTTPGDWASPINLAEVVVVAGASTTDRQKLEGYLAWKWGLEANLPVGHPYEDAAPTNTGQGGSTATVETVSAGGGRKNASGGSSATLHVISAGVGTKQGQGGSSTSIQTVATGGGRKNASGGSAVILHVVSSGAGTKQAQGGASATVLAFPSGEGRKDVRGGSSTSIHALSTGAGRKDARGGSAVAVEVRAYSTATSLPRPIGKTSLAPIAERYSLAPIAERYSLEQEAA